MSLNQKGSKTMREHFWKSHRGTAAVIVALMLIVLMGFGGFALDIGNLYVVKTKMQNAVDAAVCAGGLELPNISQATAQAKSLITANNFDPNSATVTFTQDTVKNPGNAPEINCTMTNNVRTYFMAMLGIQNVRVAALAEGIIQNTAGQSGPFNYTIFSGSPSYTLTLNGSQTVKGSVHSNDKLLINGSSQISGAAEGVNQVTINGSCDIGSAVSDTVQDIKTNGSNNIGSESGGASNIAMPDYTQQIIDSAAHVYNSSQTFNGSVDIDGSVYVNGNVILNGSIDSTGAVLADGNITVNGSSHINGSNQAFLYSANGNIIVNGSSLFDSNSSAIIYAPNGTITINGSINIHGRVIGNKVLINGSGNFNGTDYPVTSLPAGKLHVKLIR
jgi:Flp pilus assembly protein TadG